MKTIKTKWMNISKISCAVFLFCIFALVCIVFFAEAEEMDLSGVLGTMFIIVVLISGLLTVLFLIIQFVLEMRAEYKERGIRLWINFLLETIVLFLVFTICDIFFFKGQHGNYVEKVSMTVILQIASRASAYWKR